MKTLLLYLTPFLLISVLLIACQKQEIEIQEPYQPHNCFEHEAGYRCDDCSCFQVKVAKNLVKDYLIYLVDKGVEVHTPETLVDLARSSEQRVAMSEACGLDSLVLTQMVELVDLIGLGLTEREAQVLMCAHRNEMDIFTGSVMSLEKLKETNVEVIYSNVLGYVAGKEEIQHWIEQVQNQYSEKIVQIKRCY